MDVLLEGHLHEQTNKYEEADSLHEDWEIDPHLAFRVVVFVANNEVFVPRIALRREDG